MRSNRIPLRALAVLTLAVAAPTLGGCGGPCKSACPRIVNCVERPQLTIGACIEACQAAEERETAKQGGEARFQSFLTCVERLDTTTGPRLNIVGHQCRPYFARCTRELSPDTQRALNKAIHR